MITPLLLALVTATPASERALAAFVTLTPRGAAGAPAPAVLLEGVDAALQRNSGLALRSSEQLGLDLATLDACPRGELLGCITAHVASRSSAVVAVVLTVIPQGEHRHRMALTLVDVARARDALARLRSPADEDARAAAEDAIFARAFALEPATLDAHSTAAVEAWITTALRARALPEDAPDWLRPRATIALSGLVEPMSLTLDGQPRGTVAPEAPRLVDLAPGQRHLELAGVRHTASEDVELRPGQTTTVALSLIAVAAEPGGARTPLVYGSAAVAAAGLALGIVSAVSASSVTRHCLARPGDTGASCEGLGWPGFGLDGDQLPSLSSDRIDGGPPLLPIGAALFGAGAAVLALQAVFHDPDRSPWIDAAVALAAAGTGLAIGVAAAP